jgi:hypothetical protein
MTGNGLGPQTPHVSGRRFDTATTEGRPDSGATDGATPPRPLAGILANVRELVSHANLYVETRKDMVRATVRRVVILAALGLVGALAGITIIVVAAFYFMRGIAHGLAQLIGQEYWLGELIISLAVFLLLAIAAFVAIQSMKRTSRKRTIEKYELRQQQQRQQFGHTATERAQQLRTADRS